MIKRQVYVYEITTGKAYREIRGKGDLGEFLGLCKRNVLCIDLDESPYFQRSWRVLGIRTRKYCDETNPLLKIVEVNPLLDPHIRHNVEAYLRILEDLPVVFWSDAEPYLR